MPAFRRVMVLLCAALLVAAGVYGIVEFRASTASVVFHAFVLLCGGYLASTALRRES
jgi:hypothetical protein